MTCKKNVLGTVQFWMNYEINNSQGRLFQEMAFDVFVCSSWK
jgi:hypothetical protein